MVARQIRFRFIRVLTITNTIIRIAIQKVKVSMGHPVKTESTVKARRKFFGSNRDYQPHRGC